MIYIVSPVKESQGSRCLVAVKAAVSVRAALTSVIVLYDVH